MEQLFLPNDGPTLPAVDDVPGYLAEVLEKMVTKHPPKDEYKGDEALGLWVGPSGIAYLFLHLSVSHPNMKVNGYNGLHWANAYLDGKRLPGSEKPMCGLLWEPACHLALRISVTKNLADVGDLLALVPSVLADDQGDEMIYGRCGFLYLLRMVRHWVPESGALTAGAARQIAERVLDSGPDWVFHGRRLLGAGHGDIGNMTQVVLAVPELAGRVEPWLERLLDRQRADGSWDKNCDEPDGKRLVQYCHGAPGMVISLVRLRPLFPRLHDRIDAAIERGRELTWAEGVLVKEPGMCHGTLGNAMCASTLI
jgi:hypothetical protein